MPEKSNRIERYIVAGAGYVGKRLLFELIDKGHSAQGFKRNLSSRNNTDFSVDKVCSLDLDLPPSTRYESNSETCVVYLVPPTPEGDPSCRVRNFVHEILTHPPSRFVLISTTGVYGDCKGEWVDETRLPKPQTDRAQRRVEVEQYCTDWATNHNVELSILRVAAIYGPDRVPVERVRQGVHPNKEQSVVFSNRIHVDDLVRVCIASTVSKNIGTFNVADGCPMPYSEYFSLVADIWGLSKTCQQDNSEPQRLVMKSMHSYFEESRKIDNRKMVHSLGVELQYSHPEQGLLSCKAVQSGTNQ